MVRLICFFVVSSMSAIIFSRTSLSLHAKSINIRRGIFIILALNKLVYISFNTRLAINNFSSFCFPFSLCNFRFCEYSLKHISHGVHVSIKTWTIHIFFLSGGNIHNHINKALLTLVRDHKNSPKEIAITSDWVAINRILEFLYLILTWTVPVSFIIFNPIQFNELLTGKKSLLSDWLVKIGRRAINVFALLLKGSKNS